MNNTAPQPALREWRPPMSNPARAASLFGACVILALAGPFETDEVTRILPRFACWAVIVIASIITVVFYIATLTEETQEDTPPALLDRLPIGKRASLVALSVEDY